MIVRKEGEKTKKLARAGLTSSVMSRAERFCRPRQNGRNVCIVQRSAMVALALIIQIPNYAKALGSNRDESAKFKYPYVWRSSGCNGGDRTRIVYYLNFTAFSQFIRPDIT